jgi:uronate dehydrogenase
MAEALKITKGVDAIVHLGGYSVEGPWKAIHEANILGCYNVFEAARKNGVKRILFATSNHAVGFYRRAQRIDHRVYIKPDSRYGVSKVFGEALGSLYADKYGMEVFLMRIGNVNPQPIDKRRLSIWLSPRDLAQLVSIGIDHPDIRFEIVYGVSGTTFYDGIAVGLAEPRKRTIIRITRSGRQDDHVGPAVLDQGPRQIGMRLPLGGPPAPHVGIDGLQRRLPLGNDQELVLRPHDVVMKAKVRQPPAEHDAGEIGL